MPSRGPAGAVPSRGPAEAVRSRGGPAVAPRIEPVLRQGALRRLRRCGVQVPQDRRLSERRCCFLAEPKARGNLASLQFVVFRYK